MLKHPQIQRLMFLFAIAGLFAVTADFACLEDVCAEQTTGAFTSMDAVLKHRIESLDEALNRSGISLSDSQRSKLKADGQLFGVVKLDRPVKHPNGAIETPVGYLPVIPVGHPWGSKLTPADDAFYSFVEERIIKTNMFDPQNKEQADAVAAYLTKVNSTSPQFVGWTYAGGRTECPKKMLDAAGTVAPGQDAM
jgi:hypothetical protein